MNNGTATGKTFNEDLRARLAVYQEAENLTNGELAKQLNVGATQVSKYLNKHPEGDVDTLEAAAEDVLSAASRRRAVANLALFPTSVSRRVAVALETIRRTNDVGLIVGPAGAGKSCAVELYARANPATIIVTASRWNATACGLIRLVFDALESRSWKGNESKASWIEARLRGSNRLLCIDNAHRLSMSGREFVFDFHDSTRIPIALIGNESIERDLSACDQHSSRIGLVKRVDCDDSMHVAKSLARQLLPSAEETAADLIAKVAASKGRARAAKKHLLLAHDLLEGCNGDARQAIKAANLCLLSDVRLSANA